MARQYRQIPELEAIMLGMTPEQIVDLQEICFLFEDRYDQLMDQLHCLGAQKRHYQAVNGQAREQMGKSRDEADLLNRLEMLIWSIGYQNCIDIIQTLQTLRADTKQAFEAARRQAESL